MLIGRYLVKSVFLIVLSLPSVADDTRIRVVTSFSILEDLVNELGGDLVEVENLVGRDSDAHMYQPKPSDAVSVAKADLIVFNGLGFEGWMARLLANSNYKNNQVVASKGVKPIVVDGEPDPHAWQSFTNIRVYLDNITDSLVAFNPEHAAEFKQRHKEYLQKLRGLERELSEKLAFVPKDARIVVTSHDAFGYLGKEFDIQFLAPLGLSMDSDASATDVVGIINQIREQQVKALFVENISNPRLLNQISEETKVAIGGSLYSDALSSLDGPANSYFKMMEHNIESLINAFSSEGSK